MIELKGITKSYGDLKVLKGIDISIPMGKVVAIVGASGAGKSTLLHILGTLDRPDSGEIIFDGKNITGMAQDELADFRNRNIGFVFQFHHLLPEFTALENVCMPAWFAGKDRHSTEKKARELLSRLGLSARELHKPSELSGGEQQRVAVARALINDPEIILADEPSGNLDTESKEELHNMFFRLRDEMGQSFVIVTHDMTLAERADICFKMQDGFI